MRYTFLIAALMAILMLPTAAQASHNGVVTAKTHLRAGPSSNAPRLVTLRSHTGLRILGCLSGWNWCEVDAGGLRGWVTTGHISVYYRGHARGIGNYARRAGVPIIVFNERVYWSKHYHKHDFYKQRYGRHDNRWASRDCRDRDHDGDRDCRAYDRHHDDRGRDWDDDDRNDNHDWRDRRNDNDNWDNRNYND